MKNIIWITRTAMLTALLIVMQAATAGFGNTLITGSIVNLLLVVAVMFCGPATGLTVAIISPVCAKLIGIGPLWALIPFIIAGNVTLVLVWHFLGGRSAIAALITAAAAKSLVLYLSIARFAVPVLLKLPQPQAAVISGMFSLPQFFTAAIGGAIAMLVLPVLKKAFASSK